MRVRIACTVLVLLLMPFALTGCLFGPEQKTSAPIDPPPEGGWRRSTKSKGLRRRLNRRRRPRRTKRAGAGPALFLGEQRVCGSLRRGHAEGGGDRQGSDEHAGCGSEAESRLPEGFRGVLPKGTKVKGLNIQDGTATVDFSKEFLNHQTGMEKKILDAVTWTLTGFDSVERVNIWVDGRPLAKMPKGKTPAEGLTRNRGINLELAEGVNIGQSMPVTLYFLGQASDNTVYYVPVTRMINRSEDVAHSVMQQLILGPKHGCRNERELWRRHMKVNKLEVKDKTVLADFGGQLLQYGKGKSASKDAIQTIVLSLTENTGADKVKITVNGKAEATVEGKPLDKAAIRPEIVNPASL